MFMLSPHGGTIPSTAAEVDPILAELVLPVCASRRQEHSYRAAAISVLLQRHVGRLTADMPSGAGVCVLSLNGDLPLGFGTSAKATAEIHAAPTEAVSFYHHADVGEYLREEADLV